MNRIVVFIIVSFIASCCYAQEEKLEISGAIQIGNAANPTPDAGTIRWNDTTSDFEGFDGVTWLSLTNTANGALSSPPNSARQGHKKMTDANEKSFPSISSHSCGSSLNTVETDTTEKVETNRKTGAHISKSMTLDRQD